ncbi:transcriptional regulator [Candidatus Moduliflexus flocculans]|uniref:Transcriptional regulator n=1 Tax=Candidatus Moduliflexus flocculans TaxID=1499966 RepID=A0A0S6VTT4_9BACT|nr:transcriptional regulator [Candidatus Moduliflexus flocculans]
MTSAKKPRPNLRAIAERVDLSLTAVSLALRGDSSIPIETRQRVLLAAEELNYQYVPRQKKTAKSLLRIAFVIHDYGDHPVSANQFYGHILTGVEQACREQDASLSFVTLQHDHPVTAELPPVLTHDPSGILLASPYPDELIDRIRRESNAPIVLLDNILDNSPYDSVMADDVGGAYQATQYLLNKGHQQIVLISALLYHPTIIPSFRRRYWGYCAACIDAGVPPLPVAVVPSQLDPEISGLTDKYPEFEAWLDTLFAKYAPRPTAIFGVCDFLALTILRALQNMGLRIPNDVAVVGFDDYSMSRLTTPTLTTVHSYKKAMAWVAVKRLIDRIGGDQTPPQCITLETDLILRESS